MHVRAHGPKNVNVRKREKRVRGRVAKNWARHGKRVKTLFVAWTDARTGTRAKKREREETGKTGTGPCCKKLGAPWKTGENLVRGMDGCTYGHTGQKT